MWSLFKLYAILIIIQGYFADQVNNYDMCSCVEEAPKVVRAYKTTKFCYDYGSMNMNRSIELCNSLSNPFHQTDQDGERLSETLMLFVPKVGESGIVAGLKCAQKDTTECLWRDGTTAQWITFSIVPTNSATATNCTHIFQYNKSWLSHTCDGWIYDALKCHNQCQNRENSGPAQRLNGNIRAPVATKRTIEHGVEVKYGLLAQEDSTIPNSSTSTNTELIVGVTCAGLILLMITAAGLILLKKVWLSDAKPKYTKKPVKKWKLGGPFGNYNYYKGYQGSAKSMILSEVMDGT